MTRPFEGVKILDFTQVLAGPYASYQLALLGADVIKVERREGEDMRRTPLSREWAERGLAPGWQAINGNKRSLTLDLQKPEAIAIVKRIAAEVDVVMENFRPGVMDKLGLGYDTLAAENRVSQAGGLAPLYEALIHQRIQGMIMEPFDYPALDEKKIRDVTTIIEFNDPAIPHGLIMSKKALSSAERDKWRALVNEMRADGTVLRIFEKYFKPDLAKSMVDFQAPP